MPTDQELKSPAQRLMGRQTRTRLPVLPQHLEAVPPESVLNRLREIREKQRIFYNQTSKREPALRSGSPVSVYGTISRTWSPAVVIGPAGPPWSYNLVTESGQQLRRTREHLTSTEMRPVADPTTDSATTPLYSLLNNPPLSCSLLSPVSN
ncbi:hypothetical protein HPB49_022283 [Dermacentor silvarum]|uniref:Uncharacterized protein n=1 Tax=Dermacentor silvarum TaxID=543639 RepID=A0ACB8CBP6_DERSI|nr:hypothetical protein HPB49_022283 [Dermacentor silvarum]